MKTTLSSDSFKFTFDDGELDRASHFISEIHDNGYKTLNFVIIADEGHSYKKIVQSFESKRWFNKKQNGTLSLYDESMNVSNEVVFEGLKLDSWQYNLLALESFSPERSKLKVYFSISYKKKFFK